MFLLFFIVPSVLLLHGIDVLVVLSSLDILAVLDVALPLSTKVSLQHLVVAKQVRDSVLV